MIFLLVDRKSTSFFLRWSMCNGSRNRNFYLCIDLNQWNIGTFLCFWVRIEFYRWNKTIFFVRFFSNFSCPYLTTRLSPLVPIFGVILYLNVIGFILRTGCSDPGILPRGSSDEISYLEKSSRKKTKMFVEGIFLFRCYLGVPSGTTGHISLPGRTMELRMATGQILQLKYCSTCKIFRPPRVSHCSLCDACIGKKKHRSVLSRSHVENMTRKNKHFLTTDISFDLKTRFDFELMINAILFFS